MKTKEEKYKFKVKKEDIYLIIYQFIAGILMLFAVILNETGRIKTALPQLGILVVGFIVFVVRSKK